MRAFSSSGQRNVEIKAFVIVISKNLSTNLCHRLWKVNVSYQGKTSLHFDLPSLYGCRTRSPLRYLKFPPACYLITDRFIKLLYVCSPFWHRRTISCRQPYSTLAQSSCPFRMVSPMVIQLISGSCIGYRNAIRMHSNAFGP